MNNIEKFIEYKLENYGIKNYSIQFNTLLTTPNNEYFYFGYNSILFVDLKQIEATTGFIRSVNNYNNLNSLSPLSQNYNNNPEHYQFINYQTFNNLVIPYYLIQY